MNVFISKVHEYTYFPKDEDKTAFVNKKTYEAIIESLGFEPSNLKVMNYLPDNQAILFTEKQLEEIKKPKLLPFDYFK